MSRLIAAMSGGVDSAVAAARAVAAGHDVTGVHLALSRNPLTYRSGARGCCSLEDAHDARRAADVLGIPFYVWDFSEEFHRDVVVDFTSEYAAGRTPNPCLRCNESIKFAAVLERALALGFDGVVTGHYATLETLPDGTVRMHRSLDHAKDQSYVLGVLDQEQLRHSHFPLGGSLKPDVRAEAARLGITVATKPDSHDICFVADGDTPGWLHDKLGHAPGPIVDTEGRTIGHHEGTFTYTIGQRRGLHLSVPGAGGRPRYVLDLQPATATVVVGGREDLLVTGLEAIRPRWTESAPTQPFEATVQVRAHGGEHRAVVTPDGDTVKVDLLDPAEGIAPGQTVVYYDGTRVVGCATIDATSRD